MEASESSSDGTSIVAWVVGLGLAGAAGYGAWRWYEHRQKQAALHAGVQGGAQGGVQPASFNQPGQAGDRAAALNVGQLQQILATANLTCAQFLAGINGNTAQGAAVMNAAAQATQSVAHFMPTSAESVTLQNALASYCGANVMPGAFPGSSNAPPASASGRLLPGAFSRFPAASRG